MTQVQERRDPKNQRVTVSTLVEVCGNVPGTPVFEAESIDLSARGMHLRTAYLPETGTPLVCRFESKGKEIVVEGRVAWRRAATRGGEFGVEFTALDSRGVDALRELCRSEDASEGSQTDLGEPGSRVRLHIEGLGSPMKARVKTSRGSKLQVGSSLEFLKVGRRLELEDLEHGARRGAEIDGISVIVDPSTQVPQLIVALKFDGQEATPEPSVADLRETSGSRAQGMRIAPEAVTSSSRPKPPGSSTTQDGVAKAERNFDSAKATDPAQASTSSASSGGEFESEASEEDDEHPELRGKVAVLASSAEKKAKAAGDVLARFSQGAASGAAHWFKGAQERVLKLRGQKAPEQRRTTASAKSLRPTEKPKLRQQSGGTGEAEPPAHKPLRSQRTLMIAAGAGLFTVAALVLATRSSNPPTARTSPESNSSTVAASSAVALNAAPLDSAAAPRPLRDPGPRAVVTANVPLFGPTPLATTEPAPLGPIPGSDAAFIEDSEKAAAKASLRGSNMDESFDSADETSERAVDRSGKKEKEASVKKPEDVSPWGHGRMHEPIVHRLRLDGPGAALNGAVEPTGFTITIPDRKVMEPTTGITKRDPRIAKLKATNSGSGAQVSFRFKDGVPSYRVRLRRDYVEFLISSPDPKQEKNDAEAPRKKAAR